MDDAPDRIWIHKTATSYIAMDFSPPQFLAWAEYVRADLHSALAAERDAAIARAETMHRRAQKAEGLLARMHRYLATWERAAQRGKHHWTLMRVRAAARATRACTGASWEIEYYANKADCETAIARAEAAEARLAELEATAEQMAEALRELVDACGTTDIKRGDAALYAGIVAIDVWDDAKGGQP
jgi:hypothetical protein